MKKYLEKIEPKQIRLLLALAIVAILLCSYQFGYVRMNDKTLELEEEIDTLQQRYSDLNSQLALESIYDEKIKGWNEEMIAIMDQYGPANTPEKSTSFIIDLCKKTGVQIPNVSFSADEPIFTSNLVPSVNNTGIYAYRNTLSITYQATYQALKDMMSYIQRSPERRNVASLSATFDPSTGNLSGLIVINQYAMTGTGKVYEEPDLGDIPLGVDSIFGTATMIEPEDVIE